jgi:hypothetical protein
MGKKKASLGEKNQLAMGTQSVQEYLDTYAPIEQATAKEIFSTTGNAAEAGRSQAGTGMAWQALQQKEQAQNLTESGPASGAFVAKALDLSRQRGSGMGQAQLATQQAQRSRMLTGMARGGAVGRGLVDASRSGVMAVDRLEAQQQLARENASEARRAANWETGGQALGMAAGGYAQYRAGQKPPATQNNYAVNYRPEQNAWAATA